MPIMMETEHSSSPSRATANGSKSNPTSVSSNTASAEYMKRHSIAHVGQVQSTYSEPQSREHSMERRGRPSKRETYLLGTMRPPELVKNIQTANQMDTQPVFQRSREPSTHTLHSHAGAGDALLHPDKLQRVHSRTNRFKHPMNAYAMDSTIETIVPHHSSMLQQKYNNSSTGTLVVPTSSRPSLAPKTTSRSSMGSASERGSRPSVSVPMGGDLVPAFDDMNMDMDQHVEEHVDNTMSVSHIEYADTSAASSFTDAVFPHKEDTIKKSISEKQPITRTSSHHQQVGRIQQRIHALKALKDHDDDNSWNSGFSNLEQKTFLDSLNYDLQSLKRYNYKPLLSSLQRVADLQPDKLKKIHSNRDSAIDDMNNQYVKSLHPLMSDVNSAQNRRSTAYISSRKKGTENTERLKEMLRKSSEVTRSLWVESTKSTKHSSTPTVSSEGTYSKNFDLRTLNTRSDPNSELHRLQEHFAGFKLGHTVQNIESLNNDPSPKTHRVN